LTEDDIHYLVAEGARLGVIHTVERDMIEGSRPRRQPGARHHDPAAAR
jgi:hypothetical protein